MDISAREGLAVATRGVAHRFGSLEVLCPLDLTIDPGEFVAILGPSGCGKSTLLSLMSGLVSPTSGHIVVDGERLVGTNTDSGVVFQKDLLLEWRTALDNVLLQVQMRGLSVNSYRARAVELLEMVGLEDFAHVRPRGLSGGMRQRVALCRALLHHPRLLLLDEPFGALDALTREQLNVDVSRIVASANTTVVLVTHSIEEAVFLADRVLVMSPRPGRVLAELEVGVPRPRLDFPHGDSEYSEVINRARWLIRAESISSNGKT
jgi:NitT/TauT family transport system ATP-binding protein